MAQKDATARSEPPDDPLGAFCRANHASLKGSGRGPLAGLTFAVQDCVHIAGVKTGFGQPGSAELGWAGSTGDGSIHSAPDDTTTRHVHLREPRACAGSSDCF